MKYRTSRKRNGGESEDTLRHMAANLLVLNLSFLEAKSSSSVIVRDDDLNGGA